MSERATVIIPTFNRSALLALTLARLVEEEGLGEVIVADDGSSDDTAAVVAAFARRHPVRYLFQEDLGFRAGQARNLGIDNAAHDVLILLDDDCTPTIGTVRAHLEFHRRRRRVIGLGRRVHAQTDQTGSPTGVLAPDSRASEFDVGIEHAANPWRLLHSSHFSFRFSDFPLRFEPSFQGWGLEDCELGYRLWALGADFEVVAHALVIHRDDPEPNDPVQRLQAGQTPDHEPYLRNCARLLKLHPASTSVCDFVVGELGLHRRDGSGRWITDGQRHDIAPVLAHFLPQISAGPSGTAAHARPRRAAGPRPALLFVTPVAPRSDGVGIERRAAATLTALSRRFEVHLAVIPVFAADKATTTPPPAEAWRAMTLRLDACLDTRSNLTSRVVEPQLRRRMQLGHTLPRQAHYSTPATTARIMAWCGATDIAAVHVHRLYLASLTHEFRKLPAERRPFMVLDLDDDEVEAHRRMAAIAAASGETDEAETLLSEAAKFEQLATAHLATFDRVTTCSERDADRLSTQHPQAVFAVAPNSYRSPERAPKRVRDDATLRLLFVGALSYAPNSDAVEMIGAAIVPALRRLWSGQIVIDIVGANPPSRTLSAAAAAPEIVMHGWVDDLAPFYARADVALAPIRASGGTRIKILEAFAHDVPVVSSPMGAEGLAVRDQHDLLIAEGADAIALACVRLKHDPVLAERLVLAGRATLETLYSAERLGEALDAIYAPVLIDHHSQSATPRRTPSSVRS